MILALDFGLKRMGLARLINNIAIPMEPIIRKNRKQASNELKKILMEYEIKILVIGIIKENIELCKRINHFLSLVNFKGKIKYIDENLSSIEAEEITRDSKNRKKNRKDGKLDSIAATIILQRYFDSNKMEKINQKINVETREEESKEEFKSKLESKKENKIHIPVLLNEILSTFENIQTESKTKSQINYLIDCTFGFGGMSTALLDQHQKLRIIGIDRDKDAIAHGYKLSIDRLKLIHGNFSEKVKNILNKGDKKIVGILADLGVSSYQLDKIDRGFSFKSDILDMRMNTNDKINAEFILNNYSKNELESIFENAEVSNARKIAKLISEHRQRKTITKEFLQEIVSSRGKNNPLTLIYQALRIAVNNELDELENLLQTIKQNKNKLSECIIAIISFHSLEDRIVKNAFRNFTKSCICENVFKCECGNNHAIGINIYKKPIVPSMDEIKHNMRSRSAKLRAFKIF